METNIEGLPPQFEYCTERGMVDNVVWAVVGRDETNTLTYLHKVMCRTTEAWRADLRKMRQGGVLHHVQDQEKQTWQFVKFLSHTQCAIHGTENVGRLGHRWFTFGKAVRFHDYNLHIKLLKGGRQ